MPTLETTMIAAVSGLLVTLLAAIGALLVTVMGKPEKRMKHRETVEKIEGQTEVQLAAAKAKGVEAEGRASSAAVTALAQRCEAMEDNLRTVHSLLAQQVQRTDLLSSTNTKQAERLSGLQERVSHLEQQLRDAGLVHTADLATISNLREELDSHVLELVQTREALAERDERIAALEARVAELEEALRRDSDVTGDVGAAMMERLRVKAKAAKTKAATKKKGRNNV